MKRIIALFLGLMMLSGLAGADGVRTPLIFHDTHDSLFRYPFGAVPAGEEVRLRIRAGVGDFTTVTVSAWDEIRRIYLQEEMEIVDAGSDGAFEYWEALIGSSDPTILRYHFILKTEGERIVYYGDPGQDGGIGRAVTTKPEGFQLTIYYGNFRTPDWAKNAIIYQIFVDRFYDGDPANNHAADERGYHGGLPIEHREWGENPVYEGDRFASNDFFGGDLAGVIARLDHLVELGIGAIYFNPIFESTSNHKYDHGDYRVIDRAFGDNALFKELARQTRERGIHLILDASFNHVGFDSRYFDRFNRWPDDIGAYEYWSAVFNLMAAEGLEQDEAEARVRAEFIAQGLTDFTFTEWFDIHNRKVNVGETGLYGVFGAERFYYEGWWGFDAMPVFRAPYGSELNLTSFVDYMIHDENSISRRWIKYGSSGWRLDVSPEVCMAFWREFRTYTRNISFPHGMPIMIAENWHDASLDLLGHAFDSTMNYRFGEALIKFILDGDASTFNLALIEIYEDTPAEAFFVMMNLVDSHDTERVLKRFGYLEPDLFADRGRVAGMSQEEIDEVNALAHARLKMMATFKLSYPGSPTIYYGTEVGLTGHRDPDNRRTFPWERVREDNVILNHYRQLIAIRNENPVLRTGDLRTLYAQGGTKVIGRQILGNTDALGRSKYTLNYYTGEVIIIAEHNASAIVAISQAGEVGLRVDLEGFVRDGAVFIDMFNGQEYVVTDGGITLDIAPVSTTLLIARHAYGGM